MRILYNTIEIIDLVKNTTSKIITDKTPSFSESATTSDNGTLYKQECTILTVDKLTSKAEHVAVVFQHKGGHLTWGSSGAPVTAIYEPKLNGVRIKFTRESTFSLF